MYWLSATYLLGANFWTICVFAKITLYPTPIIKILPIEHLVYKHVFRRDIYITQRYRLTVLWQQIKPRSHRTRRRASTRQIKLMLKIVKSPVHTERVAWRSVASRLDQICLIFGSVDARERHATRRVRCERGFSVVSQVTPATFALIVSMQAYTFMSVC